MTKCYLYIILKQCSEFQRNAGMFQKCIIGLSARPLPKKKGIRDTFHYHLQNEGKIWELNLGVEGGESLGFQEPDSLRREFWKQGRRWKSVADLSNPQLPLVCSGYSQYPSGAHSQGKVPFRSRERDRGGGPRLFHKCLFVSEVMRCPYHGIRI